MPAELSQKKLQEEYLDWKLIADNQKDIKRDTNSKVSQYIWAHLFHY